MRVALIAAVVIAAGAIIALALHGSRPDELICPAGLRSDPQRAARLVELLESVPRGRDLVQDAPGPLHICFAEANTGVVRSDGVFVMDASGDEGAEAARLGHLLLHLIDGAPLSEPLDPARACAVLVAEAMVAEAQAHTLELRLRRDLQVTGHLLDPALEATFWGVPEAQQVGVIHDALVQEGGGAGAPDLQRAYTIRCRALRSLGAGGG
ncbi:MAG: hypothetical protein DRI90_13350 [Deltaproteobacteria bacterium]|nr:MAG: hypothetical protein DRI90_13350 [Deltaproteobacteria bacterium]